MKVKLTDDDKAHLVALEKKYQAIRDRTTLCAEGFCNGAYFWGEGGIGKSYAVITTLESLGRKFVLHNTRLSAPAFFGSLERNSKEVHVVEDVENLFVERTTMNLLRSALWGQKDKKGRQRRIVTYGVHPTERAVEFEGQVVFTGNRPLENIPELRALATRIPVLEVRVTRQEITALMKELCQQDYVSEKGILPAEVCGEVLAYFLSVYPQGRIFDLRILVRAFDDRLGVLTLGDRIASSWQDLIRSQLAGTVEPPVTRTDRISRQTDIALELSKSQMPTADKIREFQRRTGQGRDAYYRRLRELR